jgi:hypothetical protein
MRPVIREEAATLIRHMRETARTNVFKSAKGQLIGSRSEMTLRRSNVSLCQSVARLPWIEEGIDRPGR